MTIRNYLNISPRLAKSSWVDQDAVVIGKCELADDVSIWPNATLRGDVNYIKVGARSNIQDGAVLHCTHSSPISKGSNCIVGKDVTVGHNAILHGCIVEDECLIGMGAIILDHALIPKHTLIGANSLVPAGKILEGGFLYLGSPVKKIRPLTKDEKDFFKYSAKHYVKLKNDFQNDVTCQDNKGAE